MINQLPAKTCLSRKIGEPNIDLVLLVSIHRGLDQLHSNTDARHKSPKGIGSRVLSPLELFPQIMHHLDMSKVRCCVLQ